MKIESLLVYAAIGVGVYWLLTRHQASGVTVIPPNEPTMLTPVFNPADLQSLALPPLNGMGAYRPVTVAHCADDGMGRAFYEDWGTWNR